MRKTTNTIGDPKTISASKVEKANSGYMAVQEEPVRQKRKYTRRAAAATAAPAMTEVDNTTASTSTTPVEAEVIPETKPKRKYTRRKNADPSTVKSDLKATNDEAEFNKMDENIPTGLGDFDIYNIKVRLTFTTSVLGTTPSDPEIYTNFIAGKAPDQSNFDSELKNIVNSKTIKEETARKLAEEKAAAIENGLANSESLPEEDSKNDLKSTIFPKSEDGTPLIYDYQIKGFFKDTCQCLKKIDSLESSDIAAFKKIIDKLIFVFPREIPIENVGDITSCQRPLRAQTPQGERISIAVSECIPAGAQATFIISSLSKKYVAAVREWLNYGQFSGFGQWRNSGRGRFVWEEIDIETGEVKGGNKSKFDQLGLGYSV